MASQGKHGQALGLVYSVLEPHVVLAAGVSGSLLSECLCMCKSVIAKNFEHHHHHHHHHDSLLAFGEMQTQRKLHKVETQAWLPSPVEAVTRSPPHIASANIKGNLLTRSG